MTSLLFFLNDIYIYICVCVCVCVCVCMCVCVCVQEVKAKNVIIFQVFCLISPVFEKNAINLNFHD